MSFVPAFHPDHGVTIVEASELESAPKAVVRIGTAPDGLPWLLEVDRATRLRNLYGAVLSGFDVDSLEELPERVRKSLIGDVASGLLGVHDVHLESDDEARAMFVSRRPVGALLGRSILAQLLEESPDMPAVESMGAMASTNVSAVFEEPSLERAERLERSIRDRRANKHLLLALSQRTAIIGVVDEPDRALRTPQGPYRSAVFESLAALSGATAEVNVEGGKSWSCPTHNGELYQKTLLRAAQSTFGGQLRFQVPKATILELLIGLAEWVDATHERGLVHADLAPSNVLLERGVPVSFDGLNVPIGDRATAATFEWAAPEQVLGRELDPRTDVYSIGKMVTTLVGGVPFGAEMRYVVPVGGLESRKVDLLKTEGVFIDTHENKITREGQLAWQELLGRSIAWDHKGRPERGAALANQLRELAEKFPLEGDLELDGSFGRLVQAQTDDGRWQFARLVKD